MRSHCIDGRWIDGAGPALAAHAPSTGRRIWNGAAATPAEIDAACRAARAAFHPWAATALEDRIAIALRFSDLLKAQGDTLAQLIALEVGKPLWEARAELASMAAKVDISVQAYHARSGVAASDIADGTAVV